MLLGPEVSTRCPCCCRYSYGANLRTPIFKKLGRVAGGLIRKSGVCLGMYKGSVIGSHALSCALTETIFYAIAFRASRHHSRSCVRAGMHSAGTLLVCSTPVMRSLPPCGCNLHSVDAFIHQKGSYLNAQCTQKKVRNTSACAFSHRYQRARPHALNHHSA
jgi:hypothetical protein